MVQKKRTVRKSSKMGQRPLLIAPHGPPGPWIVKQTKSKFGSVSINGKKFTPSGFVTFENSSPIVAPPSWNPLLLQDGSTFRSGLDSPKLKDVMFGKRKRRVKRKTSTKKKSTTKRKTSTKRKVTKRKTVKRKVTKRKTSTKRKTKK